MIWMLLSFISAPSIWNNYYTTTYEWARISFFNSTIYAMIYLFMAAFDAGRTTRFGEHVYDHDFYGTARVGISLDGGAFVFI